MTMPNQVKRAFFHLSPRKFALSLLAALPVGLLAVWAFVQFAERSLSADMADTARDRLTLYSGTLHSALSKYNYLPYILSTHPEIKRLVAEGDNADTVNRYLEAVNDVSGSMALFVLDRDGLTLATSNWNQPESFAGHMYNYRPYFQDAMRGGSGAYFGVGATTGNPGFFATRRIEQGGEVRGVAVTKVDLSMLQSEWRSGGETVFITDEHGVIFLSSRDDWRYRTTQSLDAAAREALLYQRQYGSALPEPIAIAESRESGADILTIDGSRWLYIRQLIQEYGWTIWFLSPLTLLEQQRETYWFIGGGAVAMALLLLLLARAYYAAARARREAREAEKIRAVNRRLEEEIRIRERTEKDLIAAQDDLLHASRMAALGQMAASVAHELSQPVTAMRMFTASCTRLAEEGRHDKVAQTIPRMTGLVDRITALIGQLRHFSRKSSVNTVPVALPSAIANALAVLQFRQEAAGCIPVVSCPDDAVVQADAMQLEQVLINLVHNALDAVSLQDAGEERRVCITATLTCPDSADSPGSTDSTDSADSPDVAIAVEDTGPGLDPAARGQLFTPFFTTKKSGEGIGLGLAIVDNIVRAMRGAICVENVEPHGARFIIRLPRAPLAGIAPDAPFPDGAGHE